MEQTLFDIKEWFTDNHAPEIIANLNSPATEMVLASTEFLLGNDLPPALRWLYSQHNGQIETEKNLFLPLGAFLPLVRGAEETRELLKWQFSERDNEGRLLPDADSSLPPMDRVTGQRIPSLFSEEERTLSWFCFSSKENFHTMVNCLSGRVFSFVRQDGVYLEANSFEAYLTGVANDLWTDKYVLAGNTKNRGVTQQGFDYLERYLSVRR